MGLWTGRACKFHLVIDEVKLIFDFHSHAAKQGSPFGNVPIRCRSPSLIPFNSSRPRLHFQWREAPVSEYLGVG
eukprot:1373718-Pyramimonas_sp.AAC.1